jgi:hypothetical protein
MAATNVGGRPKNPPKPKELLKGIIPIDDIFSPEEKTIYEALIDVYLKDFEADDLTSSDIDDIMSLAMNRVLEIRLLKTTKDNVNQQLDISNAIEKMRKQNEKIKENLSSRRKDRINPNEHKGFSIVDLAVAYEEDKKKELRERVRSQKAKEEEVMKEFEKFEGNRYDLDVKIAEEDPNF